MDEKLANIPYFAHEGELSRLERINKLQWILSIILFLAFVITNIGWILYETQYETVSVSQEVDTGFGAAVVSGIGDADCGEN